MKVPKNKRRKTLKNSADVAMHDASLSAAIANPLVGLRGVAKDLFQKLGGGEYFINSERNKLSTDVARTARRLVTAPR
jgi:hypothetical protein